jgi:alpha-tubulin suppressor-like RCC1 family protein
MHYEDVYIQITNERGEKAHKELFPLFTIHMRKGNTIVDFPRSYCAKSMYSMGSGQNGALGIGSEEASQTLRRVVPLANIYSFCVGGDHAHASTSDGFYSWGSGRYSQIGDNGCTMRLTPTRIDSISHERMAHIAGSFSHTLALTSKL